MQLPLLLDRSGAGSLTDQIAGQLRQAIANAQLAGGVRLPSSRRLAEQLEVARNTVLRAYDTLMAEGWVELRPASGLFVAPVEPALAARAEPSPVGASGRSSWSMPLPALPNLPAAPRRIGAGAFRTISRPAAPTPPSFRSRPGVGFSSSSWREGARTASPRPPIALACRRCARRSLRVSRSPAALWRILRAFS